MSTVNVPGLYSLPIFQLYERIPDLLVVPLKFVKVVLAESVTVPFTLAPATVAFEFEASRTVALIV
jgi:hypothetical protein